MQQQSFHGSLWSSLKNLCMIVLPRFLSFLAARTLQIEPATWVIHVSSASCVLRCVSEHPGVIFRRAFLWLVSSERRWGSERRCSVHCNDDTTNVRAVVGRWRHLTRASAVAGLRLAAWLRGRRLRRLLRVRNCCCYCWLRRC